MDAETDSPYVWAADKDNKLEKRSVILGQYDEDLGEYEIADGLTKDDCIAYPSEVLTEGMATTTNIDEAMDTNNVDMEPLDDSSFDDDPELDGVSEYEMSDDGTVIDDPEAIDDSSMEDENLVPMEGDTEEAQ